MFVKWHAIELYTRGRSRSLFYIKSKKSKSKSKSKKTLFNVGQCKQYNISSPLKWVLVADKKMSFQMKAFLFL